ncbi:Proline/betaine transporter [Paraburkholderia aspalathi]|uniref:MFS transporter n=1 Tax=Paraburkholderia aspalathi TaxID=1324617 RepID=UPI00190D0319|nr:MFS transporter [Paraburkholderia aspalathi]MBK3843653.1 MFS transporter [Paraburkholderia aspalathi]CAE6812370.1 Proline/betaine transporter [Paraburkholderia aspalathi]CAE6857933.1 Proline/betaine transporter [Paraburkholderia aspalathi]
MSATSPSTATPTSTPQTTSATRIVIAATVGNLLEFYDFTVYSFFTLTIAKVFFPANDPVVSTLLALSAFAIGFLARPLGGFVLGHYADRRGRRAALTLTIFLMAVGSAVIALAPSYASIGLAAPVLVIAARLLQGFAQGGEFGAATATLLETGSDSARGFRASWQLASQGAAALLGSGTAALLTYALTDSQLLEWGWRVPFLIGTLIMPVGIYLRRHVVDEPLQAHGQKAAVFDPALVRKWFLVVFTIMGTTVATYVLIYYIPVYSTQYLKLPHKLSMLTSIGAAICSLALCPVWGALSDKLQRRKPLIVYGRLALIVLLYPAFWLMNQFPTLPVVVGMVVIMMFFYTMGSTPAYALMPENFPKHARAGYLGSAYAVAVAVFGGTAQLVAAWLTKATGNLMAPAWYMIACLMISLIAACMLTETGNAKLPQ